MAGRFWDYRLVDEQVKNGQPTGGQPLGGQPVGDDQGPPAAPPMSPSRAGRSSPPALVTSVVFGIIGAVLLLAGLFGGSEPLVLTAVGCGTLSLVAVLVWREQLIVAWRRKGPQAP